MKTNVLYFGDNLSVLRDKIPDESVDLHYLDPPFNSNRNYFVLFKDRSGKTSAAQEEAFTDTWSWSEDSEAAYKELVVACPNRELATTIEALRAFLKETPMMAYLTAMALRLVELHRTLSPTGSLYLHCDPTASHYLKIILDVIFGPKNFVNEIIWKRSYGHGDSTRSMGRSHDTVFFYAKSEEYRLNRFYHAHDPKYIETFFRFEDPKRGRYKLENLTSPNPRPNLVYPYKGYPPPAKGWRVNLEKMQQLDAEDRLHFPAKEGGRIMKKVFLDELGGQPMTDVWTDIKPLSAFDQERLGYPTQKPLALLQRIIEASTKPGDVVMDSFCGCGTAVVAAHGLGRHWIGIDITAVAVGIIKTRLEQAFPDLTGKVEVEGFPRDLESARQLFEQDPHRFQIWACTLIGAYPLTKKGADAGIDGWLNFLDLDDKPQRAVVQVKGGKVSVPQVRDLCHVQVREKAALSFFISLDPPTKPMKDEAVKEGFWTSAGNKDYPRVQLLSVGGLLDGSERARLPLQDKVSLLGFKAGQQNKKSDQGALFEE